MAKPCLLKRQNTGIKTKAMAIRNSWIYNSGPREYTCFVEYADNENQKHIARIDKPLLRPIPVGKEIIVKYNPPHYDSVVLVSRDVDSEK